MGLFAWLGFEPKHWYFFDAWDRDPATGAWSLLEKFQGRFTVSEADTEYVDTFERRPQAMVIRRYRWVDEKQDWLREH